MTMKTQILQRLKDIELKYDVKVLLAVESGSRAWGFASKDSDYDVRFVYVHRREWYLTLIEGRDVIEVLDSDGVMDFAGWDLKKALLLMGKGNCGFAEWLNSPTIYYKDEGFFQEVSRLKDDYFRKISAVNHYYHMAMNHDKRYLEKRGCEMKKFMYHLRGLLAAKYAALHGTYPPVLFNDLVDRMVDQENIKAEIANLVRLKKESREHNTMIVNESLVAFATGVATEIESMLGTFPEEKQMDYKKLDQFFLNILTTLDV
jgi:predicted nucleotidyltransferase